MKPKLIDYPLFHSPVEITHALVTVASQENCDGPEYDLMMEAADYIGDSEYGHERNCDDDYAILDDIEKTQALPV